jgi:hypothetical protein
MTEVLTDVVAGGGSAGAGRRVGGGQGQEAHRTGGSSRPRPGTLVNQSFLPLPDPDYLYLLQRSSCSSKYQCSAVSSVGDP